MFTFNSSSLFPFSFFTDQGTDKNTISAMHSIILILCLVKLAGGTAIPATSPNLFGDTLDVDYGCPVEYDSSASYKTGDTVSLKVHDVMSIWRHVGYCDQTISPSKKLPTSAPTGHIPSSTSPFSGGNNSTGTPSLSTTSDSTASPAFTETPTLLANSTQSPAVAITSKRTDMPSTQANVTSTHVPSAPTTSNVSSGNAGVASTTSPTSAAIQRTNSPTVLSTENPTISPTTETDGPVYYPDWYGEKLGCLNDGNQPDFMNANPSYYLSPELSLCCIKVSVLGKHAYSLWRIQVPYTCFALRHYFSTISGIMMFV